MEKDSSLPKRCKRLRKLRGDKTQKEMSVLLDVTEKTYRSWEKGEHRKGCIEKTYPQPDLERLIKMSEIFHCSIDYLLCRSDCTSVDNHYISLKTGLSDKAIEQLTEWNEKTKLPSSGFYRNSILFISDLLECCGIQAAALAQNVSDCLFYRKISETENLTSKITKGIYDKYEVKRVRTSYKFMDCLEYIYKHSKNIPTKESLQTAYPKTNEEKYFDDILGV